MNTIFNRIFQPEQPFPPMNFTRRPLLHLFWAGGVVAMVLGFTLGFILWMAQTGTLPVPDNYLGFKLTHARIQIIGFAGSFLLGFALQAGPHVVGGTPPPFGRVVPFIPALWTGLLLSELSFPLASTVGNLLISLAFVGPSYLLFTIGLSGDPQWKFSRSIPLAAAFFPLATAPWMALADPDQVLFVLWCGPVTIAMVAGQQLIHNVLKGDKLTGKKALVFLALLSLAWLTTALTTFTHTLPWVAPGMAWLAVSIMLLWGTRFITAARKFGFAAISVTLSLGFAGVVGAAIMTAFINHTVPSDAVVHLLGAGVITVLIIGVVSRVAGFFSGGAVLSDLAVSLTVLIWSVVASLRVLGSTGFNLAPSLTALGVAIGGILLTVWGIRVALRLYEIGKRPYPKQ